MPLPKEVIAQIESLLPAQVIAEPEKLKPYARDASIFEMMPAVVVVPENKESLQKLVRFVAENKKTWPELSLTGRGGGSDMSGGPLTEQIVVDLRKLNHFEVNPQKQTVTAQPGAFYREIEKETLKYGLIFPSYPASKNLCTIGGMVANNAGGELSLKYGKTENFVEQVKVILADGNEYAFRALGQEELAGKIGENSFEGQIYRQIARLLEQNSSLIESTRPKVSKNSSGYNVWAVRQGQSFNLAKLIVGSQGTLGIVSEATLRLKDLPNERGLVLVFLNDFQHLPEVVNKALSFEPASFESFDHYTFRLALRYWYDFARFLGRGIFRLFFAFLPDLLLVLTKGMPKLVLLVEFQEERAESLENKTKGLVEGLSRIPGVYFKVARGQTNIEKYWAIRRESFNLLRQKIRGLQASPFVDDVVVRPEHLAEFLPQLYNLLDKYQLRYTVAGHVGDGNFHVIPLMNLADQKDRDKIIPAADEIFGLVLKYRGSLTGEHNDGIIRSPYLKGQFGQELYNVFAQVKNIFDQDGIFNPGKKIGGSKEMIVRYMRRD